MIKNPDIPVTCLVYNNIPKYFEYRGIRSDGAPNTALSNEKILETIESFGYTKQQGIRGEKKVCALIMADKSKQMKNKLGFRQLLLLMQSSGVDEIILVANDVFFSNKKKKKNTEVLDAFHQQHPNVRVRMYPYSVFALVVPDHVAVPPHRILPPEEASALLKREMIARKDMAMIPESDPPVVWLGGEPGQIVEIKRLSETSGVSFFYRVII